MTVNELLAALNNAVEQGSVSGTSEVFLSLNEESIGPRAAVSISSANPGFDWESDRFMLEPAKEIVSAPPICPGCLKRGSRGDSYCRKCGTRFK